MDLEKIVFLYFENDTEGTFFCATFQQGLILEDVVSHETLSPIYCEIYAERFLIFFHVPFPYKPKALQCRR